MNLNNLFEGAIDDLEKRRIEDLEIKMDNLAARAKESKDPKVIAALRQEFAVAKAERDSYHYVNEHGGGGGPAQWHAYVRSHRTDEGSGSDKDTIAKVMDKVFVDGGGGNLSYMLELKAPTLDALRDKYHDDLDAIFAHASKEELAQAAQELRDMYSQVDEATVNPQFVNAQVTKILAGESRRMTNAPIAQLLAPVMKEYNLTLQQIDSMVPGGLKKAAGEYGIMMKEGFQDFNKVEPYAVCLAGKPVKQFDYYEEARRFHDNWKKKLYNQGEKEKADKITLMPLNLDEQGVAESATAPIIVPKRRAKAKPEPKFDIPYSADDYVPPALAMASAEALDRIIADPSTKETTRELAKKARAQKKKGVDEGYHADTIGAMAKAAPTFKVGDAMWTRDENGRPVSGEVVELRPGSVVFKTEDGRRFRAPEGRVMKRVHEGSMDEAYSKTPPNLELLKDLATQWQDGSDTAYDDISRLGWNIADDRKGVYIIKQSDMSGRSKIYFPELTDEGSMADASHHKTGPKFSGYYKGTQIGAPKPGQSFGAESKEMEEGAKVDRMVKHITKSEKATGKSKKDAEAIAWATANKRGMLDNANKKDEGMNFMEWAVSQGSRFNNFASNPEVYAQAKEAYVAEGMSNALSNITRRIAQPVSANTIIKNREQKKKTIKTQNFAEDEDVVEEKQKGVDGKACWDGYKRMGTKQKGGKTVDNCVKMEEDWQKANKKDKTDGMSQKAVNAYKRENPGSKLKTAVTTKPSKLKKGSKDSKRRSSYCARSKGQKDMHNIDCSKTPDKAICKARKRWNCESQEQFDAMLREAVEKSELQPGQYYVWTVYFDDGTNTRVKVTKDTFDPKAYYAKQNKVVVNVDYDWNPKNG